MCSGFVVKQKTAVELRISDWSSDVCSSDLGGVRADGLLPGFHGCHLSAILGHSDRLDRIFGAARALADARAVRYFPEAARSRGSTPGKLVHAPHRTLFWSIQCVVRPGERALPGGARQDAQIGRGSGRESVCKYV